MSYQKALEHLTNKDLQDKITVHENPSDTVEHAAQVCGCEPAQIAKTMSFLLSSGPVLIVAAGNVKVKNGAFKAQFHEKAVMIPYAEVEEKIGHAPGGVCPFGVNAGVPVYLDESLRRFQDVHVAGGESNVTVHLTLAQLECAADAQGWISVCG